MVHESVPRPSSIDVCIVTCLIVREVAFLCVPKVRADVIGLLPRLYVNDLSHICHDDGEFGIKIEGDALWTLWKVERKDKR